MMKMNLGTSGCGDAGLVDMAGLRCWDAEGLQGWRLLAWRRLLRWD